jgi:GNAT superfamily N-acetyltransferase
VTSSALRQLLRAGPDVPWRSSTSSSRAIAAGWCGRAFAGDPLQVALFPDETRRPAALAALFACRFATLPDHVVVEDDGAGAPVAVMVAALSTEPEPLFRLAALPQLARLLTTVAPSTLRRLARLHEVTVGLRAALPPHVLLDVIAVDDVARGRGHAGRFIRALRERAGALGLLVVLETQQPENVPLYRHLGFTVIAERRLPDPDVVHVVMRAG